MMLINNIYFHNKIWNFNEIFSTTITLLVTLLAEFTYFISDTNSIFLCWPDQFKILFPTRKLIKNWSQKSIEINRNFENFRLLFSTLKRHLFEKLFLTDIDMYIWVILWKTNITSHPSFRYCIYSTKVFFKKI